MDTRTNITYYYNYFLLQDVAVAKFRVFGVAENGEKSEPATVGIEGRNCC